MEKSLFFQWEAGLGDFYDSLSFSLHSFENRAWDKSWMQEFFGTWYQEVSVESETEEREAVKCVEQVTGVCSEGSRPLQSSEELYRMHLRIVL